MLLEQPFLWIGAVIGRVMLCAVQQCRLLSVRPARDPAVPRIPYDREQPGARVIVSKGRKEAQRPHASTLDDLLCFRVVLRQPPRVVERRAEVRENGFLEDSQGHRSLIL